MRDIGSLKTLDYIKVLIKIIRYGVLLLLDCIFARLTGLSILDLYLDAFETIWFYKHSCYF